MKKLLTILLICQFPLRVLCQDEITVGGSSLPFIPISKGIQEEFTFLDSVLCKKRIIILGEGSHYDGESLRIRAQITRYLQQHLGFNTVLFESNYNQFERAKTLFRHGDDAAQIIDSLTDNIILRSIEFKEFLTDIAPQINNDKIKAYGFDVVADWKYALTYHPMYHRALSDIARSGNLQLSTFLRKNTDTILFAIVSNNLGLISDSPGNQLMASVDSIIGFYRHAPTIMDTKEQTALIYQWINFRHAIEWTLERSKQALATGMKNPLARECMDLQFRDSIMALNILHLLDNSPPDSKFIIWVSAFHTMKTTAGVDIAKTQCIFPGTKTVGSFLQHSRYSPGIFHMAFITGQGNAGIEPDWYDKIIPTRKNSLEGRLLQTNTPFAFIDFSRKKTSPQPFPLFYMHPTSAKYLKADWSKVYDGVFYIRDMKPLHYPKLPDIPL